jgi:hypothetical protein
MSSSVNYSSSLSISQPINFILNLTNAQNTTQEIVDRQGIKNAVSFDVNVKVFLRDPVSSGSNETLVLSTRSLGAFSGFSGSPGRVILSDALPELEQKGFTLSQREIGEVIAPTEFGYWQSFSELYRRIVSKFPELFRQIFGGGGWKERVLERATHEHVWVGGVGEQRKDYRRTLLFMQQIQTQGDMHDLRMSRSKLRQITEMVSQRKRVTEIMREAH